MDKNKEECEKIRSFLAKKTQMIYELDDDYVTTDHLELLLKYLEYLEWEDEE